MTASLPRPFNKPFIANLAIVLVLLCISLVVPTKPSAQTGPIPDTNASSRKLSKLFNIKDLIKSPDLFTAKLSPKGSYFLTAGYVDGDLVISSYHIAQQTLLTIDSARQGEVVYLHRIYWLDDNSIFLSTYSKDKAFQKFDTWIIDIDQQSNTFNRRRVTSRGFIIDPMPSAENKVMFGAYKGKYRKKLEIYETHTDALIRDNFRNALEFENTLDDATNYQTDNDHAIRFTSTFDEEDLIRTLWYLDDDDKWQKYFEFDPTLFSFSPVGFIRENTLVVLTNVDSDLVSLFEFDVKKRTVGNLLFAHKKNDLTAAEIDYDNSTIKSVSYVTSGETQTEYLNALEKRQDTALKNIFADAQYVSISETLDASKKILFSFSSNNSGEYFYFDANNMSIFNIGRRFIIHEDFEFQKTQEFTIRDPNNTHDIEAFLTLPNKDVSHNVLIVMPHGGPIGIKDTKRFDHEVQFLSNRGYGVLQINFRGSEGYGKAFKDSGRGQFGQIIEQDISTVVNAVMTNATNSANIEFPNFDQVCAMGASYGGYSSVMLAIKHPELYKCIVARFGVYDLPLVFNDRNTKLKDHTIKMWQRVLGTDADALLENSPVYMASQINAPILITAGKLDTRASFEHSNRLKLALEKVNKAPEYLFYTDSQHGHVNQASARHELVYIDDFIRRSLDLPLPPQKYAPWRIANEYRMIAKGLSANNLVDINEEASEEYLTRAKALKAQYDKAKKQRENSD